MFITRCLGIGNKLIFGIVLGIFITGLTMVEQKAFAGTILIDNDMLTTDVGYWEVEVRDAGESRNAFLTANRVASADVIIESEIIFDYFVFVDTGTGGFRLDTGVDGNVLSGDDEVTSSGSFTGSNGNTIDWTAVSSIAAGSPIMVNVFTFTAQTGTLGTLQVFQYMDEDVDSNVFDDVFFTRGSAVATDLELFTVDILEVYGVSHSGALTLGQGLVNSVFDGWAGDRFNLMKPRIGLGNQAVSPTGVIEAALAAVPINHPVVGPGFGPIDVVSTLAWTADPNAVSAEVLTTLGGVPDAAMVQCGNGVEEGDEECDDGNGDNTDACLNSCKDASCGDTFLWNNVEQCDDGNLVNGDGCDDQCMIEQECTVDDDCDDRQFCTLDSCVDGECRFAPNPDPQCEIVGGEFIGVDTTSLILAGTQSTFSWMIPITISAIGIAIVIARKFSKYQPE